MSNSKKVIFMFTHNKNLAKDTEQANQKYYSRS